MKKKYGVTPVLIVSVFLLIFSRAGFCGKGKVELAYVEWASEVAGTNVVKAILQEKMGYDVDITPVSASAMWQAVSVGDVDAIVAAWLPTAHGHYLRHVADKVVNLGPNLNGTKIGLVVPDYVQVDSIDELNVYAEKFDRRIIGIDPGAGVMSATEKAMSVYRLDGFELVEGSGETMIAELKYRISKNQWAVATGWTPHWKFGKWRLRYLDDPKGIYGGAEHIATIVRKGLYMDMPDVYLFLDEFKWKPEDMQKVMVWNLEGADPYESAIRWIEENPHRVNEWIKKE